MSADDERLHTDACMTVESLCFGDCIDPEPGPFERNQITVRHTEWWGIAVPRPADWPAPGTWLAGGGVVDPSSAAPFEREGPPETVTPLRGAPVYPGPALPGSAAWSALDLITTPLLPPGTILVGHLPSMLHGRGYLIEVPPARRRRSPFRVAKRLATHGRSRLRAAWQSLHTLEVPRG